MHLLLLAIHLINSMSKERQELRAKAMASRMGKLRFRVFTFDFPLHMVRSPFKPFNPLFEAPFVGPLLESGYREPYFLKDCEGVENYVIKEPKSNTILTVELGQKIQKSAILDDPVLSKGELSVSIEGGSLKERIEKSLIYYNIGPLMDMLKILTKD